jgi:hypothetical protein
MGPNLQTALALILLAASGVLGLVACSYMGRSRIGVGLCSVVSCCFLVAGVAVGCW